MATKIPTDDINPGREFRDEAVPGNRLDRTILFPYCLCQHKPDSADSDLLHGYHAALSTRPNIGLLHDPKYDPDQN
jgi:hypothetical protein